MTTHCDRLLAALQDGKPKSHHELYRLGMIVHSRVADLRKRGYRIDQWRDGDDYLYQLRPALSETPDPQAERLAGRIPREPASGVSLRVSGTPRTDGTGDATDPVAQPLALFNLPARPVWS